MNYLKELYYIMEEEQEPETREHRENRKVRYSLLDKIEKTMGEDMAEKVADAFSEREAMECERFFLKGLRFGLELFQLL